MQIRDQPQGAVYQPAQLRKSAGLPQAQVAAAMGMSLAPVSQIENGRIPRQTLSVSSSSRARSSEAAAGRSDRPDPPARYRRRPRRAAPRNGPQDLQESDDIKIDH